MNLVVLLEGFLLAMLATGVGLLVDWVAPVSAAVGAGIVVYAVGLLVVLIAYQLEPASDA